MKEYRLKYLNKVYKLDEHACVFCEHCTDIFYDSHGIYSIVCDKQVHHADYGNVPPTCPYFEEEHEQQEEIKQSHENKYSYYKYLDKLQTVIDKMFTITFKDRTFTGMHDFLIAYQNKQEKYPNLKKFKPQIEKTLKVSLSKEDLTTAFSNKTNLENLIDNIVKEIKENEQRRISNNKSNRTRR